MGWDTEKMVIYGYTSAHNSPQDKLDEYLWNELKHRIHLMCDEPRYESLSLEPSL